MENIILRQPLQKAILTQGFANDFKIYRDGKLVWFYKDLYSPLLGHPGLDWQCSVGTPLYAMHDGVVMYAKYDNINGNMIQIWNKELKFKTLYGHNSEFKVNVGDKVKAGQLIALTGNTGDGTGPHSHTGLKPTDDLGNGLNNNNGYNGAIDPMPYIKQDYLGNNLKEEINMIPFVKVKGENNIYAVNKDKGLKFLIADMKGFETWCAITGQEVKFEEVDSLAGYISLGTDVVVPDREIN